LKASVHALVGMAVARCFRLLQLRYSASSSAAFLPLSVKTACLYMNWIGLGTGAWDDGLRPGRGFRLKGGGD